ncbi:MAG: DUF5330 domain-containing protein [Xanthobacteraceae bacterium]
MFFLLRMAFWLTVIFALLPMFVGRNEQPTQTAATKFNAGEAFTAATATVSDLSQFCSRRPEACAVGAEAMAAVGASAQTGVKIVLEYFQEKSATNGSRTGTNANGRKQTADKTAGDKSAARKSAGTGSDKLSRDTLLPADFGPTWRGARPEKDSDLRNPA